MEMYLFERDGAIGYDELAAILVVADSLSEARIYASEYSGDEGAGVWLKLVPKRLGPYNLPFNTYEPFSLIRDYRAG
jgi:hypothetical protein